MAAPSKPPTSARRAKGKASPNDQMPTSVVQDAGTGGPTTGYDFTSSQVNPVVGTGKGGWAAVPGTLRPIPDVAQVPQDKPDLRILGASGTSFFGGLIQNDEYNSELMWRDWVLKVEQMMRSDAQVEALFRLTVNTLLAAKWSIEPAADDDPAAAEIASFVESALFHDVMYETAAGVTLKQSWSQILRHVLLMMPYGFSPLEVCWRTEDDGEGGYWVKFAKFQPLLPRTVYRWWVGEDNELEAIQTWAWKNYAYRFTNIPVSKLLLFTHNQQGQNFEGLSILRPAFPYWWYKQNFLKINAIAIERNGVEIPLIHLGHNATTEDAQIALTQGQNARVNAAPAIVQPEDWKFEYPRMSQNHAEAILPSIEYCDVMMARAWFEQWINLGSTETGAYNLDASQKRTWLTGLQAECGDICDTFQPVIEQLVRWNYGEQAVYPKLVCSKLVAQDMQTLADALAQLGPLGYLPAGPEMNDFVADVVGVPKAPANAVEATNPSGPDGGTEQGGGMENEDSGDDGAQDDTGDGGDAAMSETAALLSEALHALYDHDAVDRGEKILFDPAHGKGGKFALYGNHGQHVSEGKGRRGKGAAKAEGEKAGGKGNGKGESQDTAKTGRARAAKSTEAKPARARSAKAEEAAKAAGHAKAEGEHRAVTEARGKGGKSAEEKVSARASAKAERESRMAEYHAGQDAEMGLKAGTAASLHARGFDLGRDTFEGKSAIIIIREDGRVFRGENLTTDNLAGRSRLASSPAEVEHFAALVRAHPNVILPRSGKAQDAILHERAARGNDHLIENFTAANRGAAHDELAGMTTGGKGGAKGMKAPLMELKAIGHVSGREFDISKGADPHYLKAVFGQEQLGKALEPYSHASLKEAARMAGARIGANKPETIRNITDALKGVSHADVLAHYQTHPNEAYSVSHPVNTARATTGAKAPAEAKATEATTRGGKSSTTEGGTKAPTGKAAADKAMTRMNADSFMGSKVSYAGVHGGEHRYTVADSRGRHPIEYNAKDLVTLERNQRQVSAHLQAVRKSIGLAEDESA